MNWLGHLFAYYRDQYGDYQAKKLLQLDGKARRERVDYLERRLTRETDISQPLWPELSLATREVLTLREDCIRAITRKNRLAMELQRGQPGSGATRKLESEAAQQIEIVENMKVQARGLEVRLRRIQKANALLKIPARQRSGAAMRE